MPVTNWDSVYGKFVTATGYELTLMSANSDYHIWTVMLAGDYGLPLVVPGMKLTVEHNGVAYVRVKYVLSVKPWEHSYERWLWSETG